MLPRGAAPLIAMRKAGNAPEGSVMVDYGDLPDPEWHRWANTMHSPRLVVRPDEPVDRLDFRCLVKLPVLLILDRYDAKAGELFIRLQEYASEISMLSSDFEADLGSWWLPRYGVIPFDHRCVVTAYEDLRDTRTHAALIRDRAAYDAAKAAESKLLEDHPWLRC